MNSLVLSGTISKLCPPPALPNKAFDFELTVPRGQDGSASYSCTFLARDTEAAEKAHAGLAVGDHVVCLGQLSKREYRSGCGGAGQWQDVRLVFEIGVYAADVAKRVGEAALAATRAALAPKPN